MSKLTDMKRNQSTFILLLSSLLFILSCREKPKSPQTENAIVKDQGVLVDYTDTRTGDTTLLFVHGWCLNKSYWDDQVAYFKKRYRVVAIDLPGFGKSGKNRNEWNTAAFGVDVDTVISQLKLKNVILVGHSMGGDIVLQAAKMQPKKVIALVGVDNFKDVGTRKKPTKADTIVYLKFLDSMRSDFRRMAFTYVNQQLFYKTTPPGIKKRILNDVAKADPNVATACLRPGNFDEATALKQTGKKLFLINSDYIATDTVGLYRNKIPFQIWYIRTTGHFPMVEKPNEFNEALQQVIKKLSS